MEFMDVIQKRSANLEKVFTFPPCVAYMMVFWDHTPCRTLSDSACISEKRAASIFRVNELGSDGTCIINLQGASTQQASRVPILSFPLNKYALIFQP
jgi:hypothetical protein